MSGNSCSKHLFHTIVSLMNTSRKLTVKLSFWPRKCSRLVSLLFVVFVRTCWFHKKKLELEKNAKGKINEEVEYCNSEVRCWCNGCFGIAPYTGPEFLSLCMSISCALKGTSSSKHPRKFVQNILSHQAKSL